MVDSINSNRLNHFNWERKVAKQKRLETQEKSREIEEQLEHNLFGQENSFYDVNDGKFNELINNSDHFSARQTVINSSLATEVLQLNSFAAKYAAEVNIEELFEFFDDNGITKTEIDKLSLELLECEEGEFADKLDFYVTTKKLSLAQIYLLLNFLYSELKKQERKKFKLSLAHSLLKDLEQQNSAYLLEFFKLSHHPVIKGNSKLAAAFADLSGGLVSIKNIRQILNFVRDNFNGDYTNLVSKSIELRMGAILRLKESSKNYETKTELTEIMSFEKNLILLNTIYKLVLRFKKNLQESKNILITDDYCQAIDAILGVCEAPMVTEMLLRNFWKIFLAQNANFSLDGISSAFIIFFQKLPDVIFHNTTTQHLKVVEGLRKVLSNNNSKPESTKFGFIRSAIRDKKNYI